MRYLLIACTLAFTTLNVVAQKYPPKHYTDSATGKLYWNKALPVYIWVSSTPDSAELRLNKPVNKLYADPVYLDADGVNYIRTKYAVDPKTMQMAQPQQEAMLEIYGDGVAPSTASSYDIAKKYEIPGRVFYGPSLYVTLTADDKTSGVENIYYSINNGPWTVYNNRLLLSAQGDYTVRYYAVDNVGNMSDIGRQVFTVDTDAPVSIININGITGKNVISTTSKMYLLKADSIAGLNGTYYKFDNEEYKPYNGREIDFTVLNEGDHTISYYSTDNVQNKEVPKVFNFYLDKSAPLMAADILGDRFITNNKIYFSGRTKLKLTAVDNKVGVKEIKYSIDNGAFKTYDQPFYLPAVAGDHDIRYYSVDNLQNQTTSAAGSGFEEFKHSVSKVYVDLTGPALAYKITGDFQYRNDTLLIGPYNRIALSANDPESGLNKISYSFDNVEAETDYQTPLAMTKEGMHRLEYFGYDNVNNRNVSEVYFFTDNSAPEIFINTTVGKTGDRDGLSIYPPSAGVFITATDTYSGLKNIYYSVDGGPEKLYTGLINGLKARAKHTIKVRAVDMLGNESRKDITFWMSK
jgi:hypothetical protein